MSEVEKKQQKEYVDLAKHLGPNIVNGDTDSVSKASDVSKASKVSRQLKMERTITPESEKK